MIAEDKRVIAIDWSKHLAPKSIDIYIDTCDHRRDCILDLVCIIGGCGCLESSLEGLITKAM